MTPNVAVVHYHLNRGGVTQVIANHLRALDAVAAASRRVLLIYGGRRNGWPAELPRELERVDCELCELPQIDYDDEPAEALPVRLADALRSALRERGFGPEESVVHIHNHALGKNVSLPGAAAELANAGFRLLLQIHDFAEDFRPANYRRLAAGLKRDTPAELAAALYPQSSAIHYAVLNGRDRALLSDAGVDPARLHLLPNPVVASRADASPAAARAQLAERFELPPDVPFYLYPVRGIRRKNTGEALLWAAACDDAWFGMTLNPVNPVEAAPFRRWTQLARELSLPFVFGLGEAGGLTFSENLAAADALLTTSVAEGFGMVFLEAWLSGRPLVGRDLPEITADFKSAGLMLDGLAPEFRIPVGWVGTATFVEQFRSAYRRVEADYGRRPDGDAHLDDQIRSLIRDETIDCAYLTGDLQAEVIRQVSESRSHRDELRAANPQVADVLRGDFNAGETLISANADAVRNYASLERCGRRLSDVYERITQEGDAAAIRPPEHGERVLDAFLDVSRFHPVRVEP